MDHNSFTRLNKLDKFPSCDLIYLVFYITINLNFRFMHTTVEGPVLWFRKNVVEAARTGEVDPTSLYSYEQKTPFC